MTRTQPAARPAHALDRLLAALPPGRLTVARRMITDPRCGGHGLRAWLALLDTDDRPLPPAVPDELIEVYLADDDAEPLHDCESCGMAVPVRVGRRCGHEAVVEREYFPTCPCCGGRTGRYAFWSRRVAVTN